MEITIIKTLWPENDKFSIVRETTGDQYIFVHFLTPAQIIMNDVIHPVSVGSCILYNKFSYQNMRADNCDVLHDWIHIEGDMDELVKKYGFEYNKIYNVYNSNNITKIIQTMENEFNIKNRFSLELMNIKLEELILNIVRDSEEKIKNKYTKMSLLNSFLELRSNVNLTYNEEWDVAKMAAFVNLSPSRFYKIYKEIFGISPKKYLQEIRIEHAKILLAQNKYMIKEIADMTGYTNQYHFIRQFKEYTGITPGKYMG